MDRTRQRVRRGSDFTPGRLPARDEAVDYGATIRQYRIHAGISQTELSRLLGLGCSTVSNWENGISRPDLDNLRALCSYLRMPPARLLSLPGSVPMPAEERELLAAYRGLPDDRKRLARALLATMAEDAAAAQAEAAPPVRSGAKVLRLADYVRASVLELGAAAGAGVPLTDTVGGEARYIRRTPEAEQADVLIRVVGNSMEPRFHNGNYLLVRYAKELRPGEVGIFVADGEGLVKEYREDGLHSINPAYATRHFGDDDNVHLIGRVLGCVPPEDFVSDGEAALLDEEMLR